MTSNENGERILDKEEELHGTHFFITMNNQVIRLDVDKPEFKDAIKKHLKLTLAELFELENHDILVRRLGQVFIAFMMFTDEEIYGPDCPQDEEDVIP